MSMNLVLPLIPPYRSAFGDCHATGGVPFKFAHRAYSFSLDKALVSSFEHCRKRVSRSPQFHKVFTEVEFMQSHVTNLPSQQNGSDGLTWVTHHNSSYSK